MKATHDCECADNCGTKIKAGEDAVGVRTFYDGQWHTVFRCRACQDEIDDRQAREDAMAAMD